MRNEEQQKPILCRIMKTGAKRGQAVAYSAAHDGLLAARYGDGSEGTETLPVALKMSRKPHTAREREKCRVLAGAVGGKTVTAKTFGKIIKREIGK